MILYKWLKKKRENRIIASEGGEHRSQFIRELAKKRYKVDAGMYSYGCFDSMFNVGGSVLIGRYTSIGPNVRYFGANHPVDHAVMSPMFYNRLWGFEVEDVERNHLVIGNDCWIGNNVTIVSSCHSIGNGSVIGAGAVVSHDVPPYAIVAGVPAKVIRYRFDEEIIDLIEKSKWWELDPEVLYHFYGDIGDPKEWARRIISEIRNSRTLMNIQ